MVSNDNHDRITTTKWTQIIDLKTADPSLRNEILSTLLIKYSKPIYAFIRQKGYTHDETNDLTQDFIQDMILEKDLIQKADQAKGRFRNFLLTSLKYYLINKTKHQNAQKRSGGYDTVSLSELDGQAIIDPRKNLTPEETFQHLWATEFLHSVFSDVEKSCKNNAMEQHWLVFKTKILDPILYGNPSPVYTELCNTLGISDEAKASNMTASVKRLFRNTLKRHLSKLVENDSDIDEEFFELLDMFSKY